MSFQITALWAFVTVDSDGEEGIIGQLMPDKTWMPFIGADEDRIRSLRPMAEKVGRETGMKIRFMKFSTKTLIEEF